MTLTPNILAMYLGCRVHLFDRIEQTTGRLAAVKTNGNCELALPSRFNPECEVISIYRIDEVKPILRRLEDMTEEEAIEIFVLEGWGNNLQNIVVTDKAIEHNTFGATGIQTFKRLRAETFAHLLSKGFDLFGLCDSGLAIDSKTIKP